MKRIDQPSSEVEERLFEEAYEKGLDTGIESERNRWLLAIDEAIEEINKTWTADGEIAAAIDTLQELKAHMTMSTTKLERCVSCGGEKFIIEKVYKKGQIQNFMKDCPECRGSGYQNPLITSSNIPCTSCVS